MRLGTVTQASPLRVRLNGDTQDAPAMASSALAVGTEVVVETLEGRRFVVYPEPGASSTSDADTFARRSEALSMIAQHNPVTWDGQNLKWTDRFISLGAGRGPQGSADGWVGFYLPPVGTTVPGYAFANTRTVTAAGIAINDHEALYGVPSSTGGYPATGHSLAIVDYRSTFTVPAHWILLAHRSEVSGAIRVMALGNAELGVWRLVTFSAPFGQYDVAGSSSLGGAWTARYRKQNGVVFIQGLARRTDGSNSAGGTIFTLPAGYRPGTGTSMFTVLASSGHARLDIQTSGAVHLAELRSGANVTEWFSLQASFPAES